MTAHAFDAVRSSPFYKSEHEAFRQSLRRFVSREIEPYANDWDEAGEFPRELYGRPPRSATWGSDFPSATAGPRATASCGIIAMQEIGARRLRRGQRGPLQPHHRAPPIRAPGAPKR